MATYLFITGAPRSGTTLLDKLVSLHQRALVLSQPLPLLYVRVKQAFLEARTAAKEFDVYPLNDMFGEHFYYPEEFLAFLGNYRLSKIFCRDALEEMKSFEGQYTRPKDPFPVLEDYRPSCLFDFVRRYTEFVLASADTDVIGSKESYCEEYVPYFLEQGAKVLLLIRDPRDIITSLNYGQGELYGGRPRPNLLNLRQWRKSVAFALQYGKHADFLAVRYEDLVADPASCMRKVMEWLKLSGLPRDLFEEDIRDQKGEVWYSNSSHQQTTRVQKESVGRYRGRIPKPLDLFIQASCFCEMKCFGYDLEIGREDVPDLLLEYSEEENLDRPELAEYAWSSQRLQEERLRWQHLAAGDFDPALFIYQDAFLQLTEGLENKS